MAKNETPAAEAPATENAAAPATDTRRKLVKAPAGYADQDPAYTADTFTAALAGETVEVARADFIRNLAKTNRYTRSDLTVLTRLAAGDPSIKYQIIFQATKGLEGVTWPVKAEPAAAAPAEAAPAE